MFSLVTPYFPKAPSPPSCEKHHRKLEFRCEHCKDSIPPMCAICMAEHYQENHSQGETHIETLAKEQLQALSEYIETTSKEKEKAVGYVNSIKNLAQKKDAATQELNEKLAKISQTPQKAVTDQNVEAFEEIKEISERIQKMEEAIDKVNYIMNEAEKLMEGHEHASVLEVSKVDLLQEVAVNYYKAEEVKAKLEGEVEELHKEIELVDTYLESMKGRQQESEERENKVNQLKQGLEDQEFKAKGLIAESELIRGQSLVILQQSNRKQQELGKTNTGVNKQNGTERHGYNQPQNQTTRSDYSVIGQFA
eukprot:TRINITY_DN106014_c0_g1_i1.p2 TRINITY_DN106014_c0_g1~~TRINITY_DN106014_c0_g1_i1.p2  ORF type:complete len:308 (-),score=49.19 TRINITY_DN106014_c0_g1_i1:1858-2781(-)